MRVLALALLSLASCVSSGVALVPAATAPVVVVAEPLSGVAELVAGTLHSCARLTSGAVLCWGRNDNGELGNGRLSAPLAPNGTPSAVLGISSAVELSAHSHTCARLSDGSVSCWGYNGSGQLGNGATANSPVPVVVSGVSDAVGISAGRDHSCALLANHSVVCWGSNTLGQLGNGTLRPSFAPVQVLGITDAVEIAGSGSHTCARKSTGVVACWGSNSVMELGDGGAPHADCFGHMDCSPVPVAVSGLTDAVELSASAHTCARRSNGTVSCWGHNSSGQLGNGTSVNSAVPVTVNGLYDVEHIATGFNYHSCAVVRGGRVWCWGSNALGQLGMGDTTARAAATDLRGLAGVTDVSAGQDHSCAIGSHNTAVCWGSNSSGQLGDGNGGSGVFRPTGVSVVRVR